MQQLNSKNYESVSVVLRGQDSAIMMKPNNGVELMDYLVGDTTSSHVGITDHEGNRIVVRTTDILRVEPVVKLPDIKDYI